MKIDQLNIYPKRLLFVLILFISMFILIEPVVFVYTNIHVLFRVGQLILLFIGIIFMFFKKINVMPILMIGSLYLYQYIITYIMGGATNKVVSSFVPILALMFILQVAFKINLYLTVKSLYYYFSFVTYLNFILMLQYPEGLINVTKYGSQSVGYNFLSVNNQLGSYLLIAATISYVYSYITKVFKLNFFILNSIIFITLFKVWSVTSILWIIVFFIIVYIFNKLLNVNLTWLKSFITMLSFHFLIVIIGIQNVFSFIIEDVFEKDLTLSGRTIIWELALDKLQSNIWFGFGELHDARYITVGTAEFNAHNIFLQLMLQGGVILLALFLIVMMAVLQKTEYYLSREIKNVIISSLMILFIMMISEVYSMVIIYFMFILTINLKDADVKKKNINFIVYKD